MTFASYIFYPITAPIQAIGHAFTKGLTEGITEEAFNPETSSQKVVDFISKLAEKMAYNIEQEGPANRLSLIIKNFLKNMKPEDLGAAGTDTMNDFAKGLNFDKVGTTLGQGLNNGGNSFMNEVKVDQWMGQFGDKLNEGSENFFKSAKIDDIAGHAGHDFKLGIDKFFKNFNSQQTFQTLGENIDQASEGFFKGAQFDKSAARLGDNLNRGFTQFTNKLNPERMAENVAEHMHDTATTFFENLDLKDVGKEVGKSTGDFIKESGKGVSEGIGDAMQSFALAYLPVATLITVASIGTPLAIYYMYYKFKHNIGRPVLATRESRTTIMSTVYKYSLGLPGLVLNSLRSKNAITPIFNAEITRRIKSITNGIKNLVKHSGYMQNIILYGPGGTGKTLIAEKIATESGMDFVMMSGGDLAQYIQRGEHVTELNKLMNSLKKSWRPTVLFIDEAESLAKDRSKIASLQHTELLNAFLNHTGTPNKKFTIVMATNRLHDLDEAVLNRMDHKIFIGPPALEERKNIIVTTVLQLFKKKEIADFFKDEQALEIATKTEGFTGRTLFKLLNDIVSRKSASDNNILTQALIDEAVDDFVKQENEVNMRIPQAQQREQVNKAPAVVETKPPSIESSVPTVAAVQDLPVVEIEVKETKQPVPEIVEVIATPPVVEDVSVPSEQTPKIAIESTIAHKKDFTLPPKPFDAKLIKPKTFQKLPPAKGNFFMDLFKICGAPAV